MRALILEVLTGAAAAHGVYEEAELGGVFDEAWPAWYTEHIHRALTERGYRIIETG
ncbi:hypothetical protein ACL9RL_13230 [Plantibacter sp. Mn2098]|uniref:hypothetical protein n=1 Tax=Plantibacter sp. Mn2098 TaxID=3395266 RepID=UPI003BCEE95A